MNVPTEQQCWASYPVKTGFDWLNNHMSIIQLLLNNHISIIELLPTFNFLSLCISNLSEKKSTIFIFFYISQCFHFAGQFIDQKIFIVWKNKYGENLEENRIFALNRKKGSIFKELMRHLCKSSCNKTWEMRSKSERFIIFRMF